MITKHSKAKGGFSKSRRNLAPEAFLELNDLVWRCFYEQVDYLGYHGHKLLAVDGTYLNCLFYTQTNLVHS